LGKNLVVENNTLQPRAY